MSENKKVAVIIPFYRESIDHFERIALEQCNKKLGSHTLIAIKPHKLTLPEDANAIRFTDVVSFENSYFENIEGYNKLMLSAEFYETFLAYDYILIYQLDAFVFKDELDYRCQQGFDYIGAPWLRDIEHPDFAKAIKSKLKYYLHTRYDTHIKGEPSKYQYENKVGNGGFSLRNVRKFYNLCIKHKAMIDMYLEKGTHHYNEDRFWSIEVNRKNKVLNIPDYKTGAKFSIEHAPPRALKLNNGQLPFGCHAWDRTLDFWRPIFKQLGYSI